MHICGKKGCAASGGGGDEHIPPLFITMDHSVSFKWEARVQKNCTVIGNIFLKKKKKNLSCTQRKLKKIKDRQADLEMPGYSILMAQQYERP